MSLSVTLKSNAMQRDGQIPHSTNCEETGAGEGLWDRLGRRKMTNMSFSTFSKPVASLCEAELTRAKLRDLENIEK